MKILTIDTSTSCCSVALTAGERLMGEYLLEMDRTLTSRLLGCVDLLLKAAGMTITDLDALGVAIGPGSFTGVRVGVASVKGLALATNKPVVGFSSLAMLAMNLPWSSMPVCPMFDARKQEVYTALYECRDFPRSLVVDCVISPSAFLATLDTPTIFVGEGAIRYKDLIVEAMGEKAHFAPWTCHQPRASAGALLAAREIHEGRIIPLPELNPCYIRLSEAELARRAKA